MKRYLAWVLVLSLLVCALPLTSYAAGKTATVTGDWLRLRDKPSVQGAILDKYHEGHVVTILGTYGHWYRVRTGNGKTGYMYSSYLRVNGNSAASSSSKTAASSSSKATKGTTAYVISRNGAPVWLRSAANKNSNAIAKYDVGTKATILERGALWHHVRIGNQEGYMVASCLSATKSGAAVKASATSKSTSSKPTASSYTAYIQHPKGNKVNVRSGASRSHSVVGAYPVGTKVTVLKHGSAWCRIRVQNKLGYIMTQFLTTDKP